MLFSNMNMSGHQFGCRLDAVCSQRFSLFAIPSVQGGARSVQLAHSVSQCMVAALLCILHLLNGNDALGWPCLQVPLKRLLLETDAPDGKPRLGEPYQQKLFSFQRQDKSNEKELNHPTNIRCVHCCTKCCMSTGQNATDTVYDVGKDTWF